MQVLQPQNDSNPSKRYTAKVNMQRTSPSSSSSIPYSEVPLYLTFPFPSETFPLEYLEAEHFALERLQLLKTLQNDSSNPSATPTKQYNPNTNSAAFFDTSFQENVYRSIRIALKKHGLDIPNRKSPLFQERLFKDSVSHFILRLALCVSPEERSWLLNKEVLLFQTRIQDASIPLLIEALKNHFPDAPDITPVSLDQNVQTLEQNLDAVARGPAKFSYPVQPDTLYYKVHFLQVLPLVKSRSVFVSNGYAYIPEFKVRDILVMHFRAQVSSALVIAARSAHELHKHKQMGPLLRLLRQRHLAFEASLAKKSAFDDNDSEGNISSHIDVYKNIQSMPLCMRNMLQHLDKTHHLKHKGRLQLGLFLKGCGLPYEENYLFFKKQFTKNPKLNPDAFEKEYAYNIRYNYGKEGQKKNFTPYGCTTIISTKTGPGECHGCPYRDFETERLRRTVASLGINDNAVVNEIVDKATSGMYQIACGMTFEKTQPQNREGTLFVPSHPNEYFKESRKRIMDAQKRQEKLMSDVQRPPPIINSQIQSTQNSSPHTDDTMQI